jgi:hypothetical protein
MKQRFYVLIIGLLCIVILILIIQPKIARFFAIDSCLDKGGQWNYELNMCETINLDSFSLRGTWIYHDAFCFELIQIQDTNNVIYRSFINRNKSIGELDKDLMIHYYQSQGKLGFIDSNKLWIATDKYRFDYLIKGDTLEEYNKMGLQKRLVRVRKN